MVMRSPRPQRVQRPPSGQRTPSRYSRGVTALPARRGGAPGGDAAAGGDSPAVLAPRRAAQGCGKARRAALRIAGKPLPRSRAHPWFCWPIRPPIYLHETVTSPDSRLPREPDAVAELAQHDGARETERSVGHRHSRGGIWRTEAIAIISIIIFPCARRDTLERPRRAFGQPGLERLPGGILCLAQASRLLAAIFVAVVITDYRLFFRRPDGDQNVLRTGRDDFVATQHAVSQPGLLRRSAVLSHPSRNRGLLGGFLGRCLFLLSTLLSKPLSFPSRLGLLVALIIELPNGMRRDARFERVLQDRARCGWDILQVCLSLGDFSIIFADCLRDCFVILGLLFCQPFMHRIENTARLRVCVEGKGLVGELAISVDMDRAILPYFGKRQIPLFYFRDDGLALRRWQAATQCIALPCARKLKIDCSLHGVTFLPRWSIGI